MLGGAPSVLTAPWFRAAFLSRQQLLARDPGPGSETAANTSGPAASTDAEVQKPRREIRSVILFG